jgi:hypothetical protein
VPSLHATPAAIKKTVDNLGPFPAKELRDAGERSELDSLKYIDLPEAPELLSTIQSVRIENCQEENQFTWQSFPMLLRTEVMIFPSPLVGFVRIKRFSR